MKAEELKNYIIQRAKKYLAENKKDVTAKEVVEEAVKEVIKEVKASNTPRITPKAIRLLAEQMKQMNKKIDLRNPLINPDGKEIIGNLLEENKQPEKKEEKPVVQESTKNRWQELLDYKIPEDDKR